MREIVYSDSGDGVFVPDLTPVQKRAATRLEKQRAERRQSRLETILGLAIMSAAALILIIGEVIVWRHL
jgi:hypothetical protein